MKKQQTIRTALRGKGKHLLMVCLQFTISSILFSQNYQSRYWYTGDKQIDLSNYASPAITTLTGLPHAQLMSTGVYWTNNLVYNTEFTITDGLLYQADGFGGYLSPIEIIPIGNSSEPEGTTTLPGSEIGIVPKPGSECGSYYIIFSNLVQHTSTQPASNTLTGLYYAEYSTDLNTGGLLVPQTPVCGTCESYFSGGSCGDYFPASIAISPKKVNNERFLYAVLAYDYGNCNVTTRLYKFRITSSGILQTDLTPGIVNDFIEFQGIIAPSETELSHDQTMLAFARKNTTNFPNIGLPNAVDLVIVKLDPLTGNLLNGNLSNVLTYNLPANSGSSNGDSYTGIEFTANNQTLYINDAEDGLRSFTISSGVLNPTKVTNSNSYSNSQLELRYFANGSTDLRICAVKDMNQGSGTFEIGYINTSANPIAMAQNNGLSNFLWQFQLYQKIGSTFTMQDQVDGEDYNTWSAATNSTACCTRYYTPNQTNYTLPATATWSPGVGNNPWNATGDLVFSGTFTVPANKTLTINNMTVRFHPGSKLIINAGTGVSGTFGGRLNLSNTTLTGLSCGQTWEGVRVLGNPSQTHLINYQGYLNMSNGATISHATYGAATWDLVNSNTSGGIIQTNGANFINNLQDVYFIYYPLASNNFFDLTNFKLDNNYRFGTTIGNRAMVVQIAPVKFRGCTFANDNNSLQTSALNTTTGIFAVDATIELDKKVVGSITTRSTVRNLNIGVNPIVFFANKTYLVQYTDFTNNQKGIMSSGINSFNILNNIFISNNANFPVNTGVFVDVGTGFQIRDNAFIGAGSLPNTVPTTFGCVVKNTCVSAGNNNGVYRNSMGGLYCANQSEGLNRGNLDTDGGLVYTCNNMQNNNLFNIRVLPDPNYITSQPTRNQGIRVQQRVGTNLATSVQNIFSHNPNVVNGNAWCDLWNDATLQIGNIVYGYDGANIPTTKPVYFNAAKVSYPAVICTTNTCAATNPVLLTFGDLLADGGLDALQYDDAKASYLNAKYLHQLLLDGGSTEHVKRNIDYDWSEDAWELRNNLINRAPNISSEALLHAANKGILPPALLFEVCLANLRSAKSPMILKTLREDVPNALPEYMIDLLNNTQESSSSRQILEDEIVASGGRLSSAYQALLTFLKRDTTADRNNQIIELLTDVPLSGAKLQLMDVYISKRDFTGASNALNSFRDAANAEKSGADLGQISQFMNFVISKAASNSFDLTGSDISYLNSVASDSAHAYFVQAHNMLRTKGLSTYEVQPLEPRNVSYKKEFEPTTLAKQKATEGYLNVYPNPAKEYMTLEYFVHTENSALVAEIIDYTGKTISSIEVLLSKGGRGLKNIEINDLPVGTYLISIKDGQKQLASKNFTKTK